MDASDEDKFFVSVKAKVLLNAIIITLSIDLDPADMKWSSVVLKETTLWVLSSNRNGPGQTLGKYAIVVKTRFVVGLYTLPNAPPMQK